jgi:uncharacterized protein (DUF433 family)
MKQYVTSNPDILGGMPVIAGTRIPITQILFLLKEGFTMKDIHKHYPHVQTKRLSAAIDEAVNLINKNGPQILQA